MSAEHLDLDGLKLAFLQNMLGRIGGADQVVAAPEKALVDAICPPDALRRAGLADADGRPTALAAPAAHRALMELPVTLSAVDRLELVRQLARLVVVDGGVDMREKSYVAMAGQLLGLPLATIADHLNGTGVILVVR